MPTQSVILFVSNRCNLECRFCFEEDERIAEAPSLAGIREMLAPFDPAEVRNVMFMGAETLLRKDAPRILEMIRDQGFRGIGVATNGTMIDGPERLRRLLDAGLEYLELSVHSLVPEHAAFLAGRDFTAAKQRRCLQAIDQLKSERALECTINTVVVRANVDDVVGVMTGIEQDFPHIRPTYYLKNAIPTPQLIARDELASLDDLRAADLGARIPEAVRHRVRLSNFPLCVVRPHYELSGELVDFLGGSTYAFLDARQRTPDAAPQEVSLVERCGACGLRALCPGVHPRQTGVVPIDDSDVRVVREVMQELRRSGGSISGPVEADLERALAPLRERADAALERARRSRATRVDTDAFCRFLLGGVPPLDLGGGVRITALRAPPDRARVELDLAGDDNLELVVHVEARTPGGRWYLATRDLALSHRPTPEDVPVARIDHALRALAGHLVEHERSTEPGAVRGLFDIGPSNVSMGGTA